MIKAIEPLGKHEGQLLSRLRICAASEPPAQTVHACVRSRGGCFPCAVTVNTARLARSGIPATKEKRAPTRFVSRRRNCDWDAEVLRSCAERPMRIAYLTALAFRIRRAILVHERLYPIGARLQFQIDVRARRATWRHGSLCFAGRASGPYVHLSQATARYLDFAASNPSTSAAGRGGLNR